MKEIKVTIRSEKMLSDLYTPVGIYLRIRDQFPGSILLESADNYSKESSFSYIAIHPIAGMEIREDQLEYKYPNKEVITESLAHQKNVSQRLMSFIRTFKTEGESLLPAAGSFFGYTAYDAIQFFENIDLNKNKETTPEIPLLRYRLYQYVIGIDHFKNELFLCENQIEGLESHFEEIETLIRIKDSPVYPFQTEGEESSNVEEETFRQMVQKGIDACQRGDLFQIVLARSFEQRFLGDEFNVYRALRSINPSPYLFFFDYGDYKLLGSSPETQLKIQDGKAIIHPIAGTVKRTGDAKTDEAETQRLLHDPKENAEHMMLVDLARNDLGKYCKEVYVSELRAVHSYSHVIHLVSEVVGVLPENANPFELLSANFPAGTLSGAPTYKALQVIHDSEPTERGFYGGCIGSVSFNGDFNHAIMIRSFLSKSNKLRYQAGAGVVYHSRPENELQEVNNKLRALKKALVLAEKIGKEV